MFKVIAYRMNNKKLNSSYYKEIHPNLLKRIQELKVLYQAFQQGSTGPIRSEIDIYETIIRHQVQNNNPGISEQEINKIILEKIEIFTKDFALLHEVHVYELNTRSNTMDPILSERYEGPYLLEASSANKENQNLYIWKETEELNTDQQHPLQSISKSIICLALGLAIQQSKYSFNHILEAPLAEFLEKDLPEGMPEDLKEQVIKNMKSVTLRQVLTMTTGLSWGGKEMYWNPTPLWVQALTTTAVDPEKFYYADGNTNILCKVIETLTGKLCKDFLIEALFTPLGINNYSFKCWQDDGVNLAASGGISLTPNGLAKIGQLILQNGQWDHGIDLSEWVTLSTQLHIPFSTSQVRQGSIRPYTGYGFQWWIYQHPQLKTNGNPLELIIGSGVGGQKLFIVKQLNLVIITHAGFYRAENGVLYMYKQCSRIFDFLVKPLCDQ